MVATLSKAHTRRIWYPSAQYCYKDPPRHQPIDLPDRYEIFSLAYVDPLGLPSLSAQYHGRPQLQTSPSRYADRQLPPVGDSNFTRRASPTAAFSILRHRIITRVEKGHEGGLAYKARETSLESSTVQKRSAVTSRLGLDSAAKQERRREQNRTSEGFQSKGKNLAVGTAMLIPSACFSISIETAYKRNSRG
jgi:hypothetical protein